MQADVDEILAKGLTDEQRKVVFSSARYVRVVAAAGTGKTETMTRKIVHLIAHGTNPSAIIAFTFTEKAAREIKERIFQRIDQG